MIKRRNIITFIAVTIISLSSFAQKGKYGTTPEDSLTCVRALSVYVDFMKQKDYKGAYTHWVKAFDVCPKSSLKMYVDGVKIYDDFIDNTEDKARKKELVDTLILIHQRRVENFGDKGKVYGRMGYYMYKYGRDRQESFNIMDTSVQILGNKSEPATLIYYFRAATDLQKDGKMSEMDVVNLYQNCMDIVSYNQNNRKKERIVESYGKAEDYINKFAEPYLSCEVIEGIANKGYESEKDNAEWMGKMANLLDKKDCTEGEVFFKVANRLHELEPSAESANKMGILAITGKKYGEAEKFFKQAVEMVGDGDNDKKAEYEFNLSKTYFGQNQYSAARTHARNAASLRSGWGEPFMLIGDMYAQSKSACEGKDQQLGAYYWAAIDKFIQAKNVEPALTEQANKKIATYSQYFPKKEDVFFHGLAEGNSYTLECWIAETTTVRVK